MKYLYHYTTVDSLEKILMNKTIRFFPLTTLDDMEEGYAEDSIAIGNCIFVSSWSEEEKEMIPMWYMYGKEGRGVRIGLPVNPFRSYSSPMIMKGFSSIEIPMKDIINNEYIVSPFHKDYILNKIEYTDDIKKLKPILKYNEAGSRKFKYGIMGKYKNTYWEFQKEWRYILNIIPIPYLDASILINCDPQALWDKFEEISDGKKKCPFDHYDLHIDPQMYQKMKVTLGPFMNIHKEKEVREMIIDCSDKICVKESELKGRWKNPTPDFS